MMMALLGVMMLSYVLYGVFVVESETRTSVAGDGEPGEVPGKTRAIRMPSIWKALRREKKNTTEGDGEEETKTGPVHVSAGELWFIYSFVLLLS